MIQPNILLIGTIDTKSAEVVFMRDSIMDAGANVVIMDVSVLGDAPFTADITKYDVAVSAQTTIEDIISYNDENTAMCKITEGAVALTRDLYASGKIDGVIILGGSMGTDLALDVTNVLPLGVPKFIVSTVSFSHMINPDRLAPDVMMILWAGGLYGLSNVCKKSLSQACGAVVGASRIMLKNRPKLESKKPRIGIMSLGKSCLKYMVHLHPALEARGYDVSVFHATGMGGQAFERLTAQGYFCAVFDFCLQEISNHASGITPIHAGPNRLTSATKSGIPQLVAPGATDMIDIPAGSCKASDFPDRGFHQHNRLISSITTNAEERLQVADEIIEKLKNAGDKTVLILPQKGIEEWDKVGEPMHDPEALWQFLGALQQGLCDHIRTETPNIHINDKAFSDLALQIFDDWVEQGYIPKGNI